jgi:hypothetical protein
MTAEQLLTLSAICCAAMGICNLVTGFELLRLRKALNSAISKVYASKPKDKLRK